MKKYQTKAFTLVELIVVVTILAILSTIGFVSYSGYLTWVRDTNRISNMKALSDWLELYRTKNTLPLPEDSVEVKANWTTIAYQWYAWANVLETIEFSNWWKDPKFDTYYSYYLTKDKKYFQLMWFLEEQENLQVNNFLPFPKGVPEGGGIRTIVQKANAAITDYSVLYPTVYGKKLGILTWTWSTPIQEDPTITNSWYLDIALTATEYVARFKDDSTLTWTWVKLQYLESAQTAWCIESSCKTLLDINSWLKWKDWIYMMNVNWTHQR